MSLKTCRRYYKYIYPLGFPCSLKQIIFSVRTYNIISVGSDHFSLSYFPTVNYCIVVAS